jgi:Zn-finger nucleic acid-binding protein
MRCRKGGLELIEIDYKGIKVDKGSGGEGVWLDAGELQTVSKLEQSARECFFDVFKK